MISTRYQVRARYILKGVGYKKDPISILALAKGLQISILEPTIRKSGEQTRS